MLVQEVEAVLRRHSEVDARGLVQLPPPPPPGGDGGGQVLGGGILLGTGEDTPESSRGGGGGIKRPCSVSPILVDSPSASPSPPPLAGSALPGCSSSATTAAGDHLSVVVAVFVGSQVRPRVHGSFSSIFC